MKADIFADLPAMPADEMLTDLLARPGVRVKRIVSPAGPRRLARSYRLRGAKVATRLNVAHVLEVPGRLAELTEHAAHAGMVIGAVAQHGLRVAPVAQWLQRQKCGRYVTSPGAAIDDPVDPLLANLVRWPRQAFSMRTPSVVKTNLVPSSPLFFRARPPHLPNIRVGLALAQIPARLLRKLSVIVADAVEILCLELFQIEQRQVSAFD